MITESLCEVVQHNCNITDANHAGKFTMCVYLMKMREYCRWDMGYSCTDLLSKEEVGEWVTQRELLWNGLEKKPFKQIEIDDKKFDPFDTDGINSSLKSRGMVYSGGIGVRCVPHFFLGRLDQTTSYDDYQVVISSEECARDLGAPPAMTLENKIFIRKESIRRMLWEKLQEWQWHKIDNAASRAFSFYDFKNDLDAALDQMTEVESHSIILHEQGEIKTAQILGEQWKQLLASVSHARLELILRAVKDFYADSISTLPTLISENNEASIHFYAANMNPIRKQLCPSFLSAYQQWCEDSNLIRLQNWLSTSATHWAKICQQLLAMHDNNALEVEIENYITTNQL
ncbi:MAG: hypothetical protein R8G33_11370 [Gammaproteobacteria bacterium]|nr:hypothetical protein [Gammaproteobacteria bacterium]